MTHECQHVDRGVCENCRRSRFRRELHNIQYPPQIKRDYPFAGLEMIIDKNGNIDNEMKITIHGAR